jgi:ribosomal-protein-alanine N-acetyltransferase
MLKLPLDGERIRLRLPKSSDRKALVDLLQDPEVHRGTLRIPYPYRTAHAVQFIRGARVRFREGRDLPMFIERRADGELLGGLGLHGISPIDRHATLGYWIGRPFRRQGYASEAVALACRAAFRELGLHRLEAAVFLFNRPSQGVMRSSGFRREGIARDAHWKSDRWQSEFRYSRLVSDPAPPRAAKRRPERPTRSAG